MIILADWGWVRRSSHRASYFLVLALLAFHSSALAGNVILAWNASTDPTVVGYNVYSGTVSRNYTNLVNAGSATSVTISNLVPGTTYYFAATTYTLAGLESAYSAEASYTVPASTNSAPNKPPTLDPIANRTINENAGPQTLNLTGISSGATNQILTLTVNAFSSNPSLIPNPIVNYTSPNTTGTLTFTPAANSFGSVAMTVMVDDSAISNNTVIRSFTITVNPVNVPPTLDPIANLTLNENAGPQTVNLTGISSGATNQIQTLTVTATSSNPALIANPTVNYSSPNSTGTLSFTAATNAFGLSTITVTVDDGQPTNNSIARSFTVTVNQTATGPTPLTNAIIAPNTAFRYAIPAPYPNGDKFNYSLGSGAPTGVRVATAHGVPYLTWTPSLAQALTTNLIQIVITDTTNPTLSTNETVLVTVLDFLALRLGSTSVSAGQSGLLPIYLSSSSGVTNLSFTVDWPASGFANPALLISSARIGSSSLQNHQTNLLITLETAAGQVLQKSNLVGQLSFQTLATQPSAFVSLPVRNITAAKPDSSAYVNYMPMAGQVAVVSTRPLLAPATTTDTTRSLTAFGNVGTTYQLQYCTNLSASPTWYPLMTYSQTNIAQTLNVDPSDPLISYRLQAR